MPEKSHSSEIAEELSTQPLHPAHRLAPGTLLADRFRILHSLGKGAQATVYSARDTLLDVDVALKLIDGSATEPQKLQAIRNEVLLARKLQHPNIVRVHDVFADQQWVFFTMAHVSGAPLYERLTSPLTRQQFERWGQQLLGALQACQQAGIRHGDIKPDNILIDENDNLQLIDFGIGRSATTEQFDQIRGHARYSAPEIIQSGTPSDTSDTYSAGAVLLDIIKVVDLSSWSVSDRLWQRRYRRIIRLMHLPNPAKRPEISAALQQFSKTSGATKPLSIGIAAALVLVLFATVLVKKLTQLGSPSLSERTLQIALVHDPAFPLLGTMGDMLRYPLLTEPRLALSDQQQVYRLVENLAIAPWDNPADRSDMAATLGADVVIILDAVPTGSRAYLVRGKVQLMPADTTLVDVTQEMQTEQIAHDMRRFGETLIEKLYASLAVDAAAPDLSYMSALESADPRNDIDRRYIIDTMQHQFPDYPGGWLAGAQMALEKNNILKVKEQLERLFALQPPSDYWHLQGQLLRAQINDDLPLAQQAINTLVEQYPARPDLFATRADIHQWANRSDAAIADYKRALQLSPNNGQWWFELARLQIVNGDIEHAINEALTSALVAFRKAGDEQGEGLVLNAFGVAHLRLADYAVAQRYFADALALRDARSQPSARATTLANLANVAAINGDYDVAEDALNEASQLLASLGNTPQQAHVLDTLGFLFEEQGQYQQALSYYKRGLDLRVQEDDITKQAESMSNVAYMHFLMGDYALAEIYWQQAATHFERLNDQAHLLRTQQNLAQLSLVKGNNSIARRRLSSIAERLNAEQPQEQMYNSLLFSYLHFSEGRLTEALSHIATATELASSTGDSRAWMEMALWQAEVCLLSADWTCVASQLEQLQDKISPQMLEPYAMLGWLTMSYRYEQGHLSDEALTQYLTELNSLNIPIVTELKIRLDIQQRIPVSGTTETLLQPPQNVPPRFYQAHLQWLYLQALEDSNKAELRQQLSAHPEYWRNHLYYQALDAQDLQQHQQTLLQDWLKQLDETQTSQYRQAYLER